jgi:uncharacterized membrane protein YhaH (DUF805 family)
MAYEIKKSFYELIWLFFLIKGRIPRALFIVGYILCLIIFYMLGFFIGLLLSKNDGLFFWIYHILIFGESFIVICLCSKRLHDINLKWYWSLLACIPVQGVFWALLFFLSIYPGNKSENRYGEPYVFKDDSDKKIPEELFYLFCVFKKLALVDGSLSVKEKEYFISYIDYWKSSLSENQINKIFLYLIHQIMMNIIMNIISIDILDYSVKIRMHYFLYFLIW